MASADERVNFYVKTVVSWGKIKDKSFQLTEREEELIRYAYLSGYEDGKNDYRDKDIKS